MLYAKTFPKMLQFFATFCNYCSSMLSSEHNVEDRRWLLVTRKIKHLQKCFGRWLHVKHFCWIGRIKVIAIGGSTATKTFLQMFYLTCNVPGLKDL